MQTACPPPAFLRISSDFFRLQPQTPPAATPHSPTSPSAQGQTGSPLLRSQHFVTFMKEACFANTSPTPPPSHSQGLPFHLCEPRFKRKRIKPEATRGGLLRPEDTGCGQRRGAPLPAWWVPARARAVTCEARAGWQVSLVPPVPTLLTAAPRGGSSRSDSRVLGEDLPQSLNVNDKKRGCSGRR